MSMKNNNGANLGNETNNTPGGKIWQRNYYERINRNENELNRIRGYIQNNPVKWEFERENPAVEAGCKPVQCEGQL